MKLDLLTNATVVDDAIRFVTSNQSKMTSAASIDEGDKEEITYGFYLISITAGLFITIFVFAIVSSLFFSAVIMSFTDFNSLATTVDVEELLLEFHFTKFI